MSDWNAGYVTDIAYTYGYYKDLNPLRVKLAFFKVGLVSPGLATACELGFGQGVGINIHARSLGDAIVRNRFQPGPGQFCPGTGRGIRLWRAAPGSTLPNSPAVRSAGV